jgi:hypothetical protein
MNIKAVAGAGIAGTSIMTAFSYILSLAKDKNFKEPLLLSLMLQALNPSIKEKPANIAGWQLHYMTGIAWAAVYIYFLKKLKRKPSFSAACIFSVICAGLAVRIWKTCFKLHPDPPKTDFKEFYRQLVVAHFLFSISMSTSYSFLQANSRV